MAKVKDFLSPECPDKRVFGLLEWCSGLLCLFTGRFMRDVSGPTHCP